MENKPEYDVDLSESFVKPFAELLLSNTENVLVDVETLLDEVGNLTTETIPVVKTFLAVGKSLKNIQAKHEWKNQIVFLRHVKSGNVNHEEIEKRNIAYHNKEKWILREVEALVIYLSKNTSTQKAILQAELYIDYINGNITDDRFIECLDITHHLFLSDIPHLIEIYTSEKNVNLINADYSNFTNKIKTKFDSVKCRRLMSNGLLIQLHPMSFGFTENNYFITSETGKYMCEVVTRATVKQLE